VYFDGGRKASFYCILRDVGNIRKAVSVPKNALKDTGDSYDFFSLKVWVVEQKRWRNTASN